MVFVRKRNVSLRRFFYKPKTYVYLENTDNINHSRGLYILMSNDIWFLCVKETSQASTWDVSFTHQKHMFIRKKLTILIILGDYVFFVYLPIMQTSNALNKTSCLKDFEFMRFNCTYQNNFLAPQVREHKQLH